MVYLYGGPWCIGGNKLNTFFIVFLKHFLYCFPVYSVICTSFSIAWFCGGKEFNQSNLVKKFIEYLIIIYFFNNYRTLGPKLDFCSM